MNNIFQNKTIALFFGGRSPEHEVSINSAKTLYPILQNMFNEVLLIYVSKNGTYYNISDNNDLIFDYNYITNNKISLNREIYFNPNKGIIFQNKIISIDLAFIAIHGNEGEDGKLQGLLDIINIKYTGCNSTSSGLCMYKDLSQQIVKNNNINTIDTLVLTKNSIPPTLKEVQKELSKNLFIKSETTGSSIGVTALNNPTIKDYNNAINNAFKFSERVLIQPLLNNILEVEVAILETENKIIASNVGVVIKDDMKETLTYDSKYGEVNAATINPDYPLDNELKNIIKNNAITIFKSLNLSGFARIDSFLYNNQVIFNEVNTIPGLTKHSHYPILINSIGISLEKAIYEICKKALW